MDPVLQEIYSLVIPAAKYVFAAYAILWIGLFGYITVVLRRLGRIESELRVVEEAVARKGAAASL